MMLSPACMIRAKSLLFGIIFLLGFTMSGGISTAVSGAALGVAAASDLRFAMEEIVAKFEEGGRIKVSYGASGAFFFQIMMGAPFDIFLSADLAYPERLMAEGHAESFFIYGRGRLVLWVPSRSRLDIEKKGMHSLLIPSIRKIAIANPLHAPYGAAAVETIKREGLYPRLSQKLVLGENLLQAAQFAQSGGAQVGILSHSLARSPLLRRTGRYWIIPNVPALPQAGIILKRSKRLGLAHAFLDFIVSGEGGEILRRHGLDTGDG